MNLAELDRLIARTAVRLATLRRLKKAVARGKALARFDWRAKGIASRPRGPYKRRTPRLPVLTPEQERIFKKLTANGLGAAEARAEALRP